jgi:hypothetical protein
MNCSLFQTLALALSTLVLHGCPSKPPVAAHEEQSQPEATGWTPTREMISELEARLVLPEGADPLSSYARHYAGSFEADGRILYGVFVAGQSDSNYPGSINIYPLREALPLIHDGGCSIIEFSYVELTNRIGVYCHGLA